MGRAAAVPIRFSSHKNQAVIRTTHPALSTVNLNAYEEKPVAANIREVTRPQAKVSKQQATEGNFESWDGTELFYRAWPAQNASNRALIFLHRGHEHSGRIAQQVEEFGMADFGAFAWDMRGHGHSPGPRGYTDNYYDHVRDLDAFVKYISTEYNIPVENMVLVANSVGAVTAAAWVHDFAPRIRAMVLAAPAFRIRLYVPLAIPGLRLLQKIKARANISSYVKSKMLTHDHVQAQSYDDDELITRNIAVNVLLGLHDLSTRIMADAGAITVPTLILSAGSDWVVKNAAQRTFYEGLSSTVKEMEVYPDFYHAVLYEKDREQAIAKSRDFIREALELEIDRSALLRSDRTGFTREEYLRLSDKAPLLKRVWFGLQKAGMFTLGRLSDGMRLGWKTGHNSGDSLDYVYENEVRGITPIGRLIDRAYLNAVGWKAMRERQGILEASLRETIQIVIGAGEPARVMDIATGRGRYVLDILEEFRGADVSALLRDRSPYSLQEGRKLASSMRLDNVTYEEGDAFDTESLLAVDPAPNIAVVSGLYELFPSNEQVLASLRGLGGLVRPGGYLIYTCQPWHPQMEEIARTCVDWDGKPWIMRRRSQAEIDELVRSAGFDKMDMGIDSHGIATVSIARKRDSS
jgi:alpha-beta hydrolase superfamily lysophospholipase/SAM-dependent methyltransferase